MPKGFDQAELTGELVRLRPIRAGDAATAFPLLQDDRISSQFGWESPASLEDLAQSYQRTAEDFSTGTEYNFTIEQLGNTGLIGSIGLRFLQHPLHLHVGYWLGVPFWGRGYMTDAVRMATYFAFRYLEVVRVSTGAFIGNTASRRVLEKNGYRFDGVLRYNTLKRGVWLDSWLLCIIRPEWEAMKEQFQPQSERVVQIPGT